MNKTFRLILLAIAFLGFCNASAQGIVKEPTTLKYEVKKLKGNKYQLIFHIIVTDSKFHVAAMNPGDAGNFAPEFRFDKSDSFKVIGKVKEIGNVIVEEVKDIGTMRYFKEKVDFIQTVEVTRNTTITGKWKYQICNDNFCLPDKFKKFSFTITGAISDTTANVPDTSNPVAVAPVNPDSNTNAGITPPAGTSTDTLSDAQKIKASSSAGLFFAGLGNGLLSVITPCVFAMLPMTVSFFLKRSKDRKTGIKIALQYSISIILIFTVIGALFAAFLPPDALHKFSTNWMVNVVFFLVFILFGISFLGAFEINLPSSWATKLDSKASTKNFVGIFFMALTLVVVSFSCTLPFIGNLIAALKDTGNKAGPIMGFFGFGLGLALPFSLFAIFPTLMNEMTKSGGWLNAVKVTFGFVEIALAMKFLSNADLTMHWRLLDREIFIAIWATLSFVLGLYLLGVIRFSHDSELPKNDWGLPYLKVPRLFFGLTAIIFTLYLIPGMWGAPLKGMSAYIPPMGTLDFNLGKNTGGGTAAAPETTGKKYSDEMRIYEPASVVNFGLDVYYDYKQALEVSKREKKPLLLDFTGINCVNCRRFESEVWSNAEVMKRMKNDFIIVSLFTDASDVELAAADKYGDVETLGDLCADLEITKFKANTQPYYFFVDENGTQLATNGVGYPTAAADFVKHLDMVKVKYRELHP